MFMVRVRISVRTWVTRFIFRVSVKAMIIVESRFKTRIRAASRVSFTIMCKVRVIISLRVGARAVIGSNVSCRARTIF